MVQSMIRCWMCGNPRHYKKDCKSKGVSTNKDSDMTLSIEGEKGDVYLASTSTQIERESWIIDSSASFYMTTHRHWFCEYEELKVEISL